MTASELREALGVLPEEDARIVAHLVETIETLARTDAEIIQAVELLMQLDERQDQRIAVLERTCALLVSHLGLDAPGSALADQIAREIEQADEHEPEHHAGIASQDGWIIFAICSCGWRGLNRDRATSAIADTHAHIERFGGTISV